MSSNSVESAKEPKSPKKPVEAGPRPPGSHDAPKIPEISETSANPPTNPPAHIPAQLDASVTPLSPPLPGIIGRILAIPGWRSQPFGWRDWVIATILFAVTSAIRLGTLRLLTSAHSFTDVLQQWDALHFVDIAQYGYFSSDGQGGPEPDVFQQRLAFFPGLPALIQQVHLLTGLGYVASGWLVVAIAGVVMTAGIMALAALLGAGYRGRILAGLLFLGAPMAVTFNMVYTEAPFLALCVWALIFMIQERWWQTTVLIYLLGFVRLTAIDLVATFAIIVLLYARTNWRAWLGVAVSGLSLITYIRFASASTQDIGGYFGMQSKGWNSTFDWGVATVDWVYSTLTEFNDIGYILSVVSIIGAPIAMLIAFRRLPWALWVFGTGITANVLLSDGIMHSRPRLLLPALLLLLPVVLWLEKLSRRVGWHTVWVVPAVLWFAFGTCFSVFMLVFFEWAI